MPPDKITDLLQQADRSAGRPARVSVSLSTIRRRVRRRRTTIAAASVAIAAVLLIVFGIRRQPVQPPETPQRIASLEDQIRELQARTDATMVLIQEVLEDERKERRLDELKAQLASIPDPLEEIERQTDKTAFTLIYRADHLYFELSQTDSAVDAYNQVIVLFPNNRWADVARQRIADIKNGKFNKSMPEGAPKWKLQKELS